MIDQDSISLILLGSMVAVWIVTYGIRRFQKRQRNRVRTERIHVVLKEQ